MAEDNPAVDLARLLGDYCLGDPQLFASGLASYRAVGAELDTPDCLVGQLARSGRLARP